MAAKYLVALVLLFGVVQVQPAVPRSNAPAIIEDLRQTSGASRIVAGWPAAPGQFNHQISLRMINAAGSVSSCGGSIIHHDWVLTAAHCVANRINFVIRFGLTNLTQPELIVETDRKFIHPRYIEIWGGVQTDDIALIGLRHSIPYGPSIEPCRLQNSLQKDHVYAGVVLTVSGFGLTDDAINGGATSEILRWTHLRGITNEECRSWYSTSTVVQAQTICAEYYNDTAQSSCQGDSGGPLTFVDEDGIRTMVGVVSFGSSAGCNSVFPSAYVRPGHYHDWYVEITGINFDWRHPEPEPSTTTIAPESSESSASSESSNSSDSSNSSESSESSESSDSSNSSSDSSDSSN